MLMQRICMIAFMLASLLTTTSSEATSSVGTTAGKFLVNNNGAATYTVPIQVPPGINGLEPKLAFAYNSQHGNGLLGVGWSLSGLSVISRCPKTIAVDGMRSGINFSGSEFCWDGQRLIPKTTSGVQDTGTDADGSYWEYRTEIESFSRIRAYSSRTNPSKFKIWTKNGHVLTFGASTDAYGSPTNANINPQGNGTLIWAINEEDDRKGNFISYYYAVNSDQSEYYPETIQYGGADSTVLTRSIVFGMDAIRTDTTTKYITGEKVVTTKRLKTITTKYDGSAVRTYTLSYGTESTGAARSLLSSIQECGSDGVCYSSPLSFTSRGTGTTSLNNATAATMASGNTFGQWNLLADVNGDGITDIFSVTDHTSGDVGVMLGLPGGGYSAAVYTTGVVTNETTLNGGFNQWNELADVNGDGIMDIFRVMIPSSGSVADAKVYLGKPDGTFNTTAIPLTGVVAYDPKGFRYLNQLTDMNGDGLMDLFSASGQDAYISYGSIANSFSLQTPVLKAGILSASTSANEGFRSTNQLADANGDGLVDVIRKSGNQILISLAQPDGSFVATTPQSGVLAPSGTWGGYANYINFLNQFVDLNGDGMLDVVHIDALYAATNGQGNGVLVDAQSSTGDITDGGYTYTNASITTEYYAYTKTAGTTLKALLGDGNGSFHPEPASTIINMGTVTFAPTQGPVNYTTCPQRAVAVTGYNYQTGQYSITVQYFGCTPAGYSVSDSNFKGLSNYNQFADMDGDGYVDLVKTDSSGNVTISFGHGDGSFSAPSGTLATVNVTDGFRAWNQLADMNGDGVPDLFAVSGTSTSQTGTPMISQRLQPGLMASVTDGNGMVTSINYEPLSNTTAYTKGSSADTYPLRKVQMPQYVVTSSDDAESGFFDYTYNYKYSDDKVDLTRGWLGFATMTRTDNHTGLETTTTFNQNFPYTQRPSSKTLRSTSANPNEYLSTTTYTWDQRIDTNVNASSKVHFVFPTGSTQTVFEPNNNYAPVLTTTTSYVDTATSGSYDNKPYDEYGNPEEVQVTYSDGHAVTTVYNDSYASSLNLGQLSQQDVTVTHTTPAPNAETSTRVTHNNYYTDGLLQNAVSQPNAGDANHELSLSSTYTYDADGRITSLSVNGADNAYDSAGNIASSPSVTRTTSYSYTKETATDLTVTKTTAVSDTNSHTESLVYDPRYGVKSGYTDPAGISTMWGYDGFGRKVLKELYSSSVQPVSTVTDFIASSDSANCPAVNGLIYCTRVTQSGVATTLSPVTTEYDALGRELRTISQDASAQTIYKDTQYDSAGRVWRVSQPYYSGGSPAWGTTTYDLAGRPWVVTAPNNATSTNTYNGLTTTVTRAASGETSQMTTTVKDSQGQVIQITDALNNVTAYKYGPFGMLETITDASGNAITLGYDIFGNKISQDDPDAGLWQYRYNAFGELKWQQDAKGQTTTYQYDYRGRITHRSDAGGVATVWTYDTPNSGLGRLDNVARGTGSSALTQTYSYDPVTGQTKTTTNKVDGISYTAQTDYDDLGRPQVITYPGAALKVKYSYYDNGALKDIANATTSATYWSATDYNAYGLPTGESWGNGLTGTRGYDLQTGALTSIATGSVQNLSYSYYKLGNLNTRTNGLDSVTETFSYDALNRLTDVTSTASGVPNKHYGYDAIGNITSKTGVGGYTYGGSRPHAVTSITPSGVQSGDANGDGSLTTDDTTAILNNILSGTAVSGDPDCNGDSQTNVLDILCVNTRIAAPASNYIYDINGNMTSGGGRTINYTTFNMPQTVDYNGERETYTYGPNYSRFSKQVTTISTGAVTQTTTYLGKLYEHIDRGGAVEERFYIPAGNRLVAEVSKSGSTSTTYYIHTDLLGSAETVTDASKAIVDNLSFDAWGLPRQANWQDGAPASGFNKTTRGYTGHETDIATGLVNMNARLYDPLLGRFLQADTVIPNAFNPQSLNTYSYVLNNPLGYTDPTGHDWMGTYNGVAAFNDGTGSGGIVATYNSGSGQFVFSDGSIIDANGNYTGPTDYGQLLNVSTIANWASGANAANGVGEETANPLLASSAPIRFDSRSIPFASIGTNNRSGYGYTYSQDIPCTYECHRNGATETPTYNSGKDVSRSLAGIVLAVYATGGTALVDALPGGIVGTLAYDLSVNDTPVTKSVRYGPTNPGALSDDIARTFRGGSYTATTLSETTTLYRAYGGSAGKVGSYWTRVKPSGPLQSQLDSAFAPQWGNTAQKVATIKVPRGTTIYEGAAERQSTGVGQILGGGNQVYIPRVDPKWIQ